MDLHLPQGLQRSPASRAGATDATAQSGSGLIPTALGFALGVGLLLLLPSLPPRWLLLLLLAIASCILLLCRRLWSVAVFALAFGLFWAQLHACAVLCGALPESLVRQTLMAEGRVVSLPEQRQEAVRFRFRIDRLLHDGDPVDFHGLVRLSWYRDPPALVAGQRWRLAIRIKPPHGFINPGGFDYERWLFEQGIKATGHVRDDPANALLAAGPGGHLLDLWRQRLRDRLDAAWTTDRPARALVRALVLGDRGALTPAQWEVFSRTGTSHLIAISGLHVGLVAGFVFLLARWLWSRSSRLMARLAAPRAAALAALMAALAYAALAGFAISTQRALLMLMVVMLALLAGRTLRPASALLLALLAVLLLHPSSLLSYGFWLSFGAVAVLLYALGRRLAPARALWRWGRAQWAIALGLLPLLLMLFGRASLIAPAVNLVAVPLFGVILPLVLIAATATLLFSWNWPLALVGLLLDQCYALLASIATLPAASMTLGGRAHWVWVAALCGVLLLLAPRGLPARWLGLVLLLPLVLMRPAAPAPGEARFTLLDVGQGLAAVVRTHAHTLVYDLGPRYPSGFETGSAVVAPYLREIGVKRVDLVVASHADQDHVGGLRGLLGAMQVSKVVSGEPDELVDDLDGLDLSGCRRGQRWRWDGVDFELLHPARDGYQGNDASCLLRVGSAAAVLLLPGDLEQGVERRLAARLGQRLKADILVAGHHGSATSTSSEFLAAVQPTWVLYTSGYANRWGFPVAEVRERVNALGLASANTATDGAVSFVLPATGALAAPQRQRRNDRRIWRHRLDAP
jgi:competence protein ComEC